MVLSKLVGCFGLTLALTEATLLQKSKFLVPADDDDYEYAEDDGDDPSDFGAEQFFDDDGDMSFVQLKSKNAEDKIMAPDDDEFEFAEDDGDDPANFSADQFLDNDDDSMDEGEDSFAQLSSRPRHRHRNQKIAQHNAIQKVVKEQKAVTDEDLRDDRLEMEDFKEGDFDGDEQDEEEDEDSFLQDDEDEEKPGKKKASRKPKAKKGRKPKAKKGKKGKKGTKEEGSAAAGTKLVLDVDEEEKPKRKKGKEAMRAAADKAKAAADAAEGSARAKLGKKERKAKRAAKKAKRAAKGKKKMVFLEEESDRPRRRGSKGKKGEHSAEDMQKMMMRRPKEMLGLVNASTEVNHSRNWFAADDDHEADDDEIVPEGMNDSDYDDNRLDEDVSFLPMEE